MILVISYLDDILRLLDKENRLVREQGKYLIHDLEQVLLKED
jgi:hypothetical protein